MIRLALLTLAGVALLTVAEGGQAKTAAPKPLSVVELFTSQGCSSCPPANANVAALADRTDVITLSFGVTYWDQLGWKDTFAQPAFTARQVAYAHALKHDAPFTPQVVVDGKADVVGARRGEIESLLANTHIAGPSLSVAEGMAMVGAGRAGDPPADIWLIRYDPRTVQVPVRAGENNGKTLPHRNVVKALIHLGDWHGAAARFDLPPVMPGLSTAVVVQTKGAGPILAVARG